MNNGLQWVFFPPIFVQVSVNRVTKLLQNPDVIIYCTLQFHIAVHILARIMEVDTHGLLCIK